MGTELSGDDLNITTHPWEGRWGGAQTEGAKQKERDHHIFYIRHLLYCSQTKITKQGTCFKENKTKTEHCI